MRFCLIWIIEIQKCNLQTRKSKAFSIDHKWILLAFQKWPIILKYFSFSGLPLVCTMILVWYVGIEPLLTTFTCRINMTNSIYNLDIRQIIRQFWSCNLYSTQKNYVGLLCYLVISIFQACIFVISDARYPDIEYLKPFWTFEITSVVLNFWLVFHRLYHCSEWGSRSPPNLAPPP